MSFLVGDVHPHDVGTFLDQDGVAVRTGQHCAQPVMDFYGITSTVRASFGLYNTHDGRRRAGREREAGAGVLRIALAIG